ncbi:ABC transporter permease [Shewanella marina]|uniref:ABC transporter permease n=1 Tax=Shewanella marina TaxID=487319 RepID=UPI000472F136|nr:ABC transporter permease [Shewanella marina]
MNSQLNSSLVCLQVFGHHYRRAPLQAGAILIGIILAITLLIGVRATNESAIASYQNATELLSQRADVRLNPPDSQRYFNQDYYFALRHAGYSNLLPVIRGKVYDNNNQSYPLYGSDIIAALSLNSGQDNFQGQQTISNQTLPMARLLMAEPLLVTSQSFADQLGLQDNITLNGQTIELMVLDDRYGLGNTLLADISFAQQLLDAPKQLSYIAMFYPEQGLKQALLAADLLPADLVFSVQDQGQSLMALTNSFHLNLNAMSMLAFIVGLFIAYNGVRYSLMKRQKLLVQLLQSGISRRHLMLALFSELTVMVIIGAVIGFVLGLQLSQWLQPMIAVTIESLYNARLLPGIWHWSWLLQAIILTLLAAVLASIPLYLNLSRQPLAQGASQHNQYHTGYRSAKYQAMAAVALLFVSGLLLPFSQQFQFSLILMALVTLAIPLLLPWSLQRMSQGLTRLKLSGLKGYMLAETKELIAPLSLAMMAILLALCANIAMNTLVGSFDHTLRQWLDIRLHTDVYTNPEPAKIEATETFLKQHPNVTALHYQWFSQDKYQGLPISLVSFDDETLIDTSPLKQHIDNFWPQFLAGSVVMISEPMAIKHNLQPGDQLYLTEHQPETPLTVGAIYYDYGNPKGQIQFNQKAWLALGLHPQPNGIGASYQGDVLELEQQLQQQVGLLPRQMFNQTSVRAKAITIFNRTFSITVALNSLTLIVAAIGLFSACLMLTQARQAPLARLTALGVSKIQLRLMLVVQMLIIVLFTCLIALPMGSLLSYLLINKVTLQAFGWTIPILWDWQAYGQAIVTAVLTSLIAISLPLWWQTRKPTIHSLQQEVL